MYIGKIISIGRNKWDTKNIEIIDLLNPRIKYKISAENTVKDRTEVKSKSKVYSIENRYTLTTELESDGHLSISTKQGVNQPRDAHSCAKMSLHGKTIIVAAGGVTIMTAPKRGLRSVEIFDVSSPDPKWKYGKL